MKNSEVYPLFAFDKLSSFKAVIKSNKPAKVTTAPLCKKNVI